MPPPTKPKPFSTRKNNANIVGDGKENQERDPVQVYCRIRPLKQITDLICIRPRNNKVVQMIAANGSRTTEFTFEHVFTTTASQKEVFENVCLPLVQDVVNGKNGLLFTYGITSSGKTHTICGMPTDPGILPRSLDILFNSIKDYKARKCVFKPDGQNGFTIQSPEDAILERQNILNNIKTPATPAQGFRNIRQKRQDAQDLREWNSRTMDRTVLQVQHTNNAFSVFLSYVEIYNNYVYDLLDDSAMDQLRVQPKQPMSKVVREGSNKRVFVQNCTEIEVATSEEAFEVFLKGVRRKRMAHTALNAESSRSHSVFNIRVVQAPVDIDGEVVQNSNILAISQLSLVDLAGSERTGRTGTTGERLREAGNINNSLMVLRQCIDIMRENQKNNSNKVIPYRDNKLTHLFKNYFEGEGKVRMIICVNPSADEYEETMNVMKFAETTQEVTIGRACDIVFRPHNVDNFDFAGGIQFAAVGTLCRPPPTNLLSDLNDEKIIPEWMDWLDEHKKAQLAKSAEITQTQFNFRKQVIDMEQENLLLRQQVAQLRSDLEARSSQIRLIESEKETIARESVKFERQAANLDKQIRSLEQEIKNKDSIICQERSEKENMKQNYMESLRQEQARLKTYFLDQISEVEDKLRHEKCLNLEKLHLVKEILQSGSEGLKRLSERYCPN